MMTLPWRVGVNARAVVLAGDAAVWRHARRRPLGTVGAKDAHCARVDAAMRVTADVVINNCRLLSDAAIRPASYVTVCVAVIASKFTRRQEVTCVALLAGYAGSGHAAASALTGKCVLGGHGVLVKTCSQIHKVSRKDSAHKIHEMYNCTYTTV